LSHRADRENLPRSAEKQQFPKDQEAEPASGEILFRTDESNQHHADDNRFGRNRSIAEVSASARGVGFQPVILPDRLKTYCFEDLWEGWFFKEILVFCLTRRKLGRNDTQKTEATRATSTSL
jgi:hypothetical protein